MMRSRLQSDVGHLCMLRKLFCVTFGNRRSNTPHAGLPSRAADRLMGPGVARSAAARAGPSSSPPSQRGSGGRQSPGQAAPSESESASFRVSVYVGGWARSTPSLRLPVVLAVATLACDTRAHLTRVGRGTSDQGWQGHIGPGLAASALSPRAPLPTLRLTGTPLRWPPLCAGLRDTDTVTAGFKSESAASLRASSGVAGGRLDSRSPDDSESLSESLLSLDPRVEP
jgi:hypothetical protein